ncbi:MAG: hypothetical protein OEU90_07995 [Gammaproteobacteria bacterium]|jgi:hypothetical protein|nr:hypothetical protein [Gammaproteobacteria bacterium]MDH3750322.1 hypothetical protein [Gammaproteobacteria bacterium]MDH3805398.1 hypothetical protein [Gammaproteobacteria bacterium]
MSYHADRFYAAVAVLAGHGHIKQRLIKAYEENLVAISEDELPISVKQTFSDLKHQMHRVTPLNGEGPICASVRKMSVEEAAECAALVVALHGEVSRLGDGGQAVLPLDGKERRGVPPFLIKSN